MRPTFWSDATVAELPVHARLTFIGLWGMSDDDGYFDWRPYEIAAELYRYDPTKTRVRYVEGDLAKLTDSGLVERLECGVHGLIDSMPKHRTQGGRHTFPTREAHLGTCIAGRVLPRPSASRPYRDVSGSGSVSNGSDSGAPPRADVSPLDAVAAATGGFVGNHAANRKTA